MAQFIVNESGLADSATFLVVRTNRGFARPFARRSRHRQPRARRRASALVQMPFQFPLE
jgi:hypothetical protein